MLDGAIGVSAGAVFGCNYKSHQIGRVIRYNTQYCNDKRYASFGNLLRTGNLYSCLLYTSVHMHEQVCNALLCQTHLALALKGEGLGDDANGQDAQIMLSLIHI